MGLLRHESALRDHDIAYKGREIAYKGRKIVYKHKGRKNAVEALRWLVEAMIVL